MEKKIILPEGYELVESGNEYIVRKKDTRPESWKKFCKEHPIKPGEAWIGRIDIVEVDTEESRLAGTNKNYCTSKEEAEAFLALMQLRQLRKAWVGNWKTPVNADYGVIFPFMGSLTTGINCTSNRVLSFPTEAMAKDFLNCFRDLCETAKPLL